MAPTQQPDDAAFAANPTPPVGDDPKAGLLGLLGGHGPKMSDLLKQHHERRQAEAEMHVGASKTATKAIMMVNQGIDPETGQRLDDPAYKGAGKDALLAKYKAQYDKSWGEYKKIAGVDKDAKGALAKAEQIIQHLHAHGGPKVQGGDPGMPGAGIGRGL